MGGRPRAFFDRRQNEYGVSARKSTGLTRPVRRVRAARMAQEINMLTRRNLFFYADERVTVPRERPTSGPARRQVKPY